MSNFQSLYNEIKTENHLLMSCVKHEDRNTHIYTNTFKYHFSYKASRVANQINCCEWAKKQMMMLATRHALVVVINV